MGRVGAGKTTLLRQFVRLLDPPPGQVFLDGQDIRDYPLGQLRAQTDAGAPGHVPVQRDTARQPHLRQTRAANIDSIWAAAEAAGLKETIEGFPDGMDTVVGERGVTLSGGQVQRATLARGLIRDAPVLLLDDCFSSVDTETEERILKDLRRLRRGKTTIVVSHRVSTARHCDRILVLDAGRIIEAGTHEELTRQAGLYVEFERIQREGAGESDYRGAAAAPPRSPQGPSNEPAQQPYRRPAARGCCTARVRQRTGGWIDRWRKLPRFHPAAITPCSRPNCPAPCSIRGCSGACSGG